MIVDVAYNAHLEDEIVMTKYNTTLTKEERYIDNEKEYLGYLRKMRCQIKIIKIGLSKRSFFKKIVKYFFTNNNNNNTKNNSFSSHLLHPQKNLSLQILYK